MKKRLMTALISSTTLLAGCAKSGEPVSFADVCLNENDAVVSIEGYLILPNYMSPATNQKDGTINYQLYLTLQPDGKGQTVLTSVAGTSSNEPNRIADLPSMGYTYKDFQIFTDQGSTVSAADKVRVTGKLVKNTNSCQIRVEKIEAP